jgi:hypothetical protein
MAPMMPGTYDSASATRPSQSGATPTGLVGIGRFAGLSGRAHVLDALLFPDMTGRGVLLVCRREVDLVRVAGAACS